MNETTYDVRVWATRVRKGAKGQTYQVRWGVNGTEFNATYATRKLADSARSELLTASRRGEAFDLSTGRPGGQPIPAVTVTWLSHAMAFMDMKWPDSAPRHRKSTAEGLMAITSALTVDGPRRPDGLALRKALTHWAFNTAARRSSAAPPSEYAPALEWIEANSRPLTDLADPACLRGLLSALAVRLDGRPAAASTVARKRAALSGALGYAVELGHLSASPMTQIRARRQRVVDAVDPRSVVNHGQAQALLAAVHGHTPALHAFFACMYYAGLRPSEARNLRDTDLTLPDGGWGALVLHSSYQGECGGWTDDGAAGEERALKHRARQQTRSVPASPQLVAALRAHLDEFGVGAEGRLFVTRAGGRGRPVADPFVRPVGDSTVSRVWQHARAAALTRAQHASPLARRPYDLRHACVSTWLAAGVSPTQVATWAGHGVAVLLRVYAHSIDGQEEAARRKIELALGGADHGPDQK